MNKVSGPSLDIDKYMHNLYTHKLPAISRTMHECTNEHVSDAKKMKQSLCPPREWRFGILSELTISHLRRKDKREVWKGSVFAGEVIMRIAAVLNALD